MVSQQFEAQAPQPPSGPDTAQALSLHDGDDVAVMVSDGRAGQLCRIRSHGGEVTETLLQTAVPFGHKVAMRAIAQGEAVLKYGQPVGRALVPIPAGSHIHIHNMGGFRSSLLGHQA